MYRGTSRTPVLAAQLVKNWYKNRTKPDDLRTRKAGPNRRHASAMEPLRLVTFVTAAGSRSELFYGFSVAEENGLRVQIAGANCRRVQQPVWNQISVLIVRMEQPQQVNRKRQNAPIGNCDQVATPSANIPFLIYSKSLSFRWTLVNKCLQFLPSLGSGFWLS